MVAKTNDLITNGNKISITKINTKCRSIDSAAHRNAKRKSPSENLKSKRRRKKINFLNITQRHRKNVIATRECCLGIPCFAWISLDHLGMTDKLKKAGKKYFFFFDETKKLRNCNRNSIRGRYKAYLVCISKESKRLAGENKLRQYFGRGNESSAQFSL